MDAIPSRLYGKKKKGYTSKQNYHVHLVCLYQIILKSSRNHGNSNLTPGPFHPHFRCIVCVVAKKSLKAYHKHYKYIHHVILHPSSVANPNATVDLHSASFYCAQYEHHYSTGYFFR